MPAHGNLSHTHHDDRCTMLLCENRERVPCNDCAVRKIPSVHLWNHRNYRNHKPLKATFKKALNDCQPRIWRFRLRLQKYNLNVQYTNGQYMHTTNAFSERLMWTINRTSTEQDVQLTVDAIILYMQVTDENKYANGSETLESWSTSPTMAGVAMQVSRSLSIRNIHVRLKKLPSSRYR